MTNDKQQRKKIMHITHGLGGIQTYLEYMLKYSDRSRFEYIIAAPYNIPFQRFCNGLAKYYPLKVKREVKVFADISLLIKLIRLIRKEKPDILHVHSAKGGFLGRLAGRFSKARVIYTPHGFSYLSFTGIKRMFYFMLECISRKWSNLLLAVSYSEANRAGFEIGYQPGKVKVIMNAICSNERPRNRNYDSHYRIGMIGRLTHQKNPMLFMNIAERLLEKYPHLRFTILGAGLDDHLGSALNDFIAGKKIQHQVILLPWGDNHTSRIFIEETDIFVLTSIFEGLPYSLLEAMEGGCACVVSKADGNADVIQNSENGFSCLSTAEFCNAIERLIQDRSLREKIGEAGRRYVHDHHNIVPAIEQLQDVYSTV